MNIGNANAAAPANDVKCAGDHAVQASNRKLNAIQTVMTHISTSAPKAKERLIGLGKINKRSVKEAVVISKIQTVLAGLNGSKKLDSAPNLYNVGVHNAPLDWALQAQDRACPVGKSLDQGVESCCCVS
jgi:hypothetical protein